MYKFLLLGLLVGILLAVWVIRLRRASKHQRRWKPDIHRVT